MEALTAIIKNLLKKTRLVLILGVVLGLFLGLIIGWGIWPVQWTNATPTVLREDLQKDYLRMTIDSYIRTQNRDVAMQRWNNLGNANGYIYGLLQTDPGYLTQPDIQNFGLLVQSVTGTAITTTPPTAQTSLLSQLVLYASIAIVIVLLGLGGLYLWRLLRRGTGPVTAVMQAAEASRQAERTDFQSLGLAPPITQTMTTYVLGDDLYDESIR